MSFSCFHGTTKFLRVHKGVSTVTGGERSVNGDEDNNDNADYLIFM